MDIEKINEMWAEDCRIDRNKIHEESLKSATLHQKYLQLLLQVKTKLLKTEKDIGELKMAKYRYYRGEMTKDELAERGWTQYQGIKPVNTVMEFILDNDSDVGTMNLKIQYLKNMVYQLESILNSIKGRDWAIRNHVEWQKFQAGN